MINRYTQTMFLTSLIFSIGLYVCSGYDNLSFNQTADEHIIYTCFNDFTCSHYKASNAIDGNITTCARTRFVTPSGFDHVTWWRVDLGSIFSIHSVRIQFKEFGEQYAKRQRGRFAGFSLYVSNTTIEEDFFLCYKNGPKLPPLDFTINCSKHGRYIKYYNERLKTIDYPDDYELNAYIDLCEVTVKGCKSPGRYGSNCSLQCPKNCQNQRCDIVNGTCLGCRPGWTGTFCNQSCEVGFYGLECNETCSSHCVDKTTCSYVNGNCEKGCVEGFGGMKCEEECEYGNYGMNCAFNCSGNCLGNLTCNRFSGKCEEGCIPGYTGVRCDEECPFGSFGLNCSKKCSFTCKSGCNHMTGNCNAGCKAGYHGEKCDKLCRFGRYGNNCSKDCSLNCVNQSCDHEMGACKYGCIPGWEDPKCSEECSPMTFGPKCKHQCSGHCAGSQTCNHVTGICANGCKDGYNGSLCDLKCVEGYFGTNCLRRCSENCTNTCNHVSGICDCTPGFSNDPYCKEVLKGEQTAETNTKTVALIFSVGFNILLLCSVVFLIRTIQIKRKTESKKTEQNVEPFNIENSMDVHY